MFKYNMSVNLFKRVKARLKPELLQKDITLRNECKSTYSSEYTEKHSTNNSNDRRAIRQDLGFIRIQQEQVTSKFFCVMQFNRRN